MAGKLAIARPIPLVLGSGSANITNVGNLLTPDPKEAATFLSGSSPSAIFDFGATKSVDTIFVGFMPNAQPIQVWFGTTNGGAEVLVQNITPQASTLVSPVYHAVMVLAAPISARYFRVNTNGAAIADGSIGVAAAGLSVPITWGHEFGSGRPIEDTGTIDRLFSGGFGIYEGARMGGYQWTFGDLYDSEVQALYALALDRGNTRSVIVVEDPTQSSGLNERTHWSLFDRLEPYERQVPGASRYAFKVRDWA